MKSVNAWGIFILMISLSLGGTGLAFAYEKGRPYKSGELLVKFKTQIGSKRNAIQRHTSLIRKMHSIGNSNIHRIILESGTNVEDALEAYANDPNIEIAEPNYIIRPQAIPNDTQFLRQWGLYNTGQTVNGARGRPGIDIDAPQAWDIITDGAEVIVAVVDTGCDIGHPDLADNLWYNPGEIPGDGVDNDRNGFIDDVHGWDFSDGDNTPHDASGHGTHVAGTIAAVGNNKRGIAGVAWNARIMPVRIMNGFDEGTTADAIDAIEYAIDNGAKIINCSWGGANLSIVLKQVISKADALFVCAAGNNAMNTDVTPYYPASYNSPNIISVAASDQMDQMSGFSNYGTNSVDVAAPGVGIFSLTNGRQTLWADDFSEGQLTHWTTDGSEDVWEITSPVEISGAPVLATSPIADYGNNMDTWAQLPTQNLSTAFASLLTFKISGSSETNADYLTLELSTNGSVWTRLPLKYAGTIHHTGITGNLPYWMTVLADLGPWDGEPRVCLRFRFKSDANTSGDGFYIDKMQLTASSELDNYQFMQGTSMAAAFVCGLSALIQTENAALEPLDIKSIIVNSVDLDQVFIDKVGSGGRANVYNALTLLRELSLDAITKESEEVQLTWTSTIPLSGEVVIQRRMDNESEFTTIAQVDAADTEYADSDVFSDATYYYRVEAETLTGDNGFSHQTLAGAVNSSIGDGSGSSGSGGGCFITAISGPSLMDRIFR